MSNTFTVELLESHLSAQKYDEAINCLFEFAARFHRHPYLDLGQFLTSAPSASFDAFAIRMSSALARLFGDPRFSITDARWQRLLPVRSMIWNVLSADPLQTARPTAAALLSSMNEAPDTAREIALLHSPEWRLPIDMGLFWARDRQAAATLALGIAGELFTGSPAAYAQRNALLEWLPGVMHEIRDLLEVDVIAIWQLYLHCSYANTPRRHDIKRNINTLVRAKLREYGSFAPASASPPRSRPLMLVFTEAFNSGHSIVRTHSRTLLAARAHFEVVALCFAKSVDEQSRQIFDRVIELPETENIPACIETFRQFAAEMQPDVFYMPSVGMSVLSIFLSNVRLAPLQIAGLGHPATTHSDCIDYVSVEADYVGDTSCFSERLMLLPSDGQPYAPSARLESIGIRRSRADAKVHVAIAASMMKLNPDFLSACGRIARACPNPIHFHFLTSGSTVLLLMRLSRVLDELLPADTYTVHGFTPYPDYVRFLNEMDMFLSPFPFGNTNGIVDAFTVNLPGICKMGSEVFERIDGAMFKRAGMPEWTVTDTENAYIDAAIRLAENHEERESLRQHMRDTNAVQRFFEGRPEAFGEAVLRLMHALRTA